MAATASRLSLYTPHIRCYLPIILLESNSTFSNYSTPSLARGQFSIACDSRGAHSAKE